MADAVTCTYSALTIDVPPAPALPPGWDDDDGRGHDHVITMKLSLAQARRLVELARSQPTTGVLELLHVIARAEVAEKEADTSPSDADGTELLLERVGLLPRTGLLPARVPSATPSSSVSVSACDATAVAVAVAIRGACVGAGAGASASAGAGASADAGAEADALLDVYMRAAPAGFVEPLCMPDRLEVGDVPPERNEIVTLYKNSRASFWTEDEIDLAHDMRDYEALTADERHFVTCVLAFFAQADGLVADNCCSNFADEITWREFRGLFGFQTMIEHIHNITYTQLIHTYVKDGAARHRLFKAVAHIPSIAAKAAWMHKYMDRRLPLAARLVAFVVAEGVFFSGSFCAIFWLKKRGKMPGLTFSNEVISRDEGLHARTSVLAYSFITRKLPEAYVHAMFRDAVAVEHAFVRDALPVALLGMNADAMCQYICYTADVWLPMLGYAKVWNVANPFDWMDLISLQGKTNFFEKRVGEYAKATLVGSGGDTFDTTVEF